MPGWAVALIAVGSVVTYMTIGMAVGLQLFWFLEARDAFEPGLGSCFAGALWPFAIWLVLAMHLIDRKAARIKAHLAATKEREYFLAQARKDLDPLVIPEQVGSAVEQYRRR